MHTVPHFNKDGGCDPSLTVEVKSELDHESNVIFTSGDVSGGRTSRERLTREFSSREGVLASPSADIMDVSVEVAPGLGTRVAGDICMTMMDGRSKAMFFFWVHSALMTEPPPEMGGRARTLSAEECAAEGLPPTSWSLLLSKHEIDRAAKDARCAHFDPDFQARPPRNNKLTSMRICSSPPSSFPHVTFVVTYCN
jgi:hypothetical protein